jgi:hypothetical protein
MKIILNPNPHKTYLQIFIIPIILISLSCYQDCPITWQSKEKITALNVDLEAITSSIKNQATANPSTDSEKIAAHAFELVSMFPPKRGLNINGIEFYLSTRICSTDKRMYAILYNNYNKQWYARPLYRSFSGGVWRATHSILFGVYDKGMHYTQDYLLHSALDKMLNSPDQEDCQSYDGDLVSDFFGLIKVIKSHLVPEIALNVKNKFLSLFELGEGFNDCNPEIKEKFLQGMTKSNLMEGFYPNFSCLNRTYFSSHSILSPLSENKNHTLVNNIQVDVFLSQVDDRVVEWHFAYEKGTKEPWVSRIRFADEEISSYGSDKSIIHSGAITAKPFEYDYQIKCLEKDIDYKIDPDLRKKYPTYVDIRPFLQNFPPIIDYKAHKNKLKTW